MRVRGIMLLAATALALEVAPVAGQTLFEWPDTAVDVSTYATVEECRAAVTRARTSLLHREVRVDQIWRDTMPADPTAKMEPLPAPVERTSRLCMERFASADTIPIEDYRFFVPLYMHAGWEDKARILVERRLAAVDPDDEEEFAAAIDTIVDIYRGRWPIGPMRVQPPRFALIEEIVAAHLSRLSDRVKRFRIYWKLMYSVAMEGIADTARAEQSVARVVAVLDSLTESERRRMLDDPNGSMLVDEDELRDRFHGILEFDLGKAVYLDSLRRSTAAYVKMKHEAWTRMTGQPAEAYLSGEPIGERAPALEGDIWLGCESPCETRPRPGHTSLVVFLTHGCARVISTPSMMAGNCARILIPLRRLANRFPELEITVVARINGFFAYLKEGLTPAREAELARRWLDSFGLEQTVLTMTDPPYWRLSEHDRRRIVDETANVADYGFGKSWVSGPAAQGGATFLVDADGIIVRATNLSRHSESDLAELIEILLERDRTGV